MAPLGRRSPVRGGGPEPQATRPARVCRIFAKKGRLAHSFAR